MLCPSVLLNIPDLYMPFVIQTTKIDYVCSMHEIVNKDISSGSNVVDLFWSCMSHPTSLFYLI